MIRQHAGTIRYRWKALDQAQPPVASPSPSRHCRRRCSPLNHWSANCPECELSVVTCSTGHARVELESINNIEMLLRQGVRTCCMWQGGRRMSTAGRPIECKAAVARGVGDLRIETITVAPPQPGEVRLKVRSACSLASWAPTLSRYIRMHCVTPTSTH